MATDTRLEDLLARWQALREQGRPAPPEELCRDCPDLLEEFRRRLEAREAAHRGLQTTSDATGAYAAPTGTLPTSVEGPTEERRLATGYEILAELGRGGMGVVYKARHIALERLVALKMILAGSHAGPAQRARFIREAVMAASLGHPNIVQIHEVGEADGKPFFSMELVEGGSLKDRLDRGPLPPEEAARLIEALARAVDEAHRHGILHRDLKPGNILLAGGPDTPAGQWVPKIADFGLAKQLDADAAQTRTGDVLGTPCYMAPEQARGDLRALGPATDLYALGAILYELLTGRPPFRADNPFDTLLEVVSREVVPPSRLRPGIPRDLETICLECLQKDPAARYPSGAALADDLRCFLAGQPIQARPISWAERGLRWARRHRTTVALAALSVVSVLGLVLVAALTLSRREPAPGPATAYPDDQVRRAAAAHRQALAKRLWQARTPSGWIPRKLVPNPPPNDHEVWAHSQALWAVLSTADGPALEPRKVLQSLDDPFAPGVPVEKDGVRYGWLAHPDCDYPIAQPAIHTASALAVALRRPDLLTAEDAAHCRRRLAYTQDVLQDAYRPAPFTGGWDMFPRQVDPAQVDPYTTVATLLALLEVRRSGLPWEGSTEQRDQLLARTAAWLGAHFDASADPPGWRSSNDPADPVTEGLTLQAYAVLLQAEREAGLPVPRKILDAIPAHLATCADRPLSYPSQTGKLFHPFRLSGQTEPVLRQEGVKFLWYPWAIACSSEWLRRAEKEGAAPEDVARVRQTLGHLVVDLGDRAVEEGLSGWTFIPAETLYAMTTIPAP